MCITLGIEDEELRKLIKEKLKDVIIKYENSGQIVPPVAKAIKEDFGIDDKDVFPLRRPLPAEVTTIEPGKNPTEKDLLNAVKLANEFIENLKQERKDVHDAALHYLGFQEANKWSCSFLFDFLAKLRNEESSEARQIAGKFFGLNAIQTDNLSDPKTTVINVLNKYKEFWKDVNEAAEMIVYVFEGIDTDKLGNDESMIKSVINILKSRIGRHFAPGINPVS